MIIVRVLRRAIGYYIARTCGKTSEDKKSPVQTELSWLFGNQVLVLLLKKETTNSDSTKIAKKAKILGITSVAIVMNQVESRIRSMYRGVPPQSRLEEDFTISPKEVVLPVYATSRVEMEAKESLIRLIDLQSQELKDWSIEKHPDVPEWQPSNFSTKFIPRRTINRDRTRKDNNNSTSQNKQNKNTPDKQTRNQIIKGQDWPQSRFTVSNVQHQFSRLQSSSFARIINEIVLTREQEHQQIKISQHSDNINNSLQECMIRRKTTRFGWMPNNKKSHIIDFTGYHSPRLLPRRRSDLTQQQFFSRKSRNFSSREQQIFKRNSSHTFKSSRYTEFSGRKIMSREHRVRPSSSSWDPIPLNNTAKSFSIDRKVNLDQVKNVLKKAYRILPGNSGNKKPSAKFIGQNQQISRKHQDTNNNNSNILQGFKLL